MNLAKQARLEKMVHLSVASSVGLLIVATFVLNNFLPGQSGNVLSQATTGSKSAHNADIDLIINDETVGAPDLGSASKRVSVKLSIENLTAQTIQLSPGLQMFLRTASGRQYNLTARYLAPGLVIGGPLLAGASSELTVDFDIPNTDTPAVFVYQSDAGTVPVSVTF